MWTCTLIFLILVSLVASGFAEDNVTSNDEWTKRQIVKNFFQSWFGINCVDKIKECVESDCLGCSTGAEMRRRHLYIRGSRWYDDRGWYDWQNGDCSSCGWYNLNCTDIYNGSRDLWNCTGTGGNETLFCETLNECWWGGY